MDSQLECYIPQLTRTNDNLVTDMIICVGCRSIYMNIYHCMRTHIWLLPSFLWKIWQTGLACSVNPCRWMVNLWLYVLSYCISVVSGWWEADNEKLCAMALHLQLKRFPPQARTGFGVCFVSTLPSLILRILWYYCTICYIMSLTSVV